MAQDQWHDYFEISVPKSLEIGRAVEFFYDHLNERSMEESAAAQAEVLQIEVENMLTNSDSVLSNDNDNTIDENGNGGGYSDGSQREQDEEGNDNNEDDNGQDGSNNGVTPEDAGEEGDGKRLALDEQDGRDKELKNENGPTDNTGNNAGLGLDVNSSGTPKGEEGGGKAQVAVESGEISKENPTNNQADTTNNEDTNEEDDEVVMNEDDDDNFSEQEIDEDALSDRVKFKQLLLSSASPQSKASKAVELIVELLRPSHISCRQMAMLLRFFPEKNLHRTNFGSYRVELVVSLFPRLVDIHNFECIIYELTSQEIGCIFCRLGWLNIFNPCKPDGAYELDLSQREQRMVAKIFWPPQSLVQWLII